MNIVLSSIAALKNPRESARITILLLAKELQKQGHEVRIIARGSGQEQIQGVVVYRTSLIKIPWLLYILNKQKKIDIIHCFSAAPVFILPHIFSPGKIVFSLKSYSRTRWGRVGYSFLAFARAITVPTAFFSSRLPFKKKMHILHSPIDTDKFYPASENKLHKKKIVYYGALSENKGIRILLQIVPYVVQQEPEAQFQICSRHANIKHWLNLSIELGIDKHCNFITSYVDIAQEVRSAGVIVLPYLNLRGTDGNPSCLLEAMVSEISVVTTHLP